MKNKKFMWIIGIISIVAAASAALTAFLIVKDKQKPFFLYLEGLL